MDDRWREGRGRTGLVGLGTDAVLAGAVRIARHQLGELCPRIGR